MEVSFALVFLFDMFIQGGQSVFVRSFSSTCLSPRVTKFFVFVTMKTWVFVYFSVGSVSVGFSVEGLLALHFFCPGAILVIL